MSEELVSHPFTIEEMNVIYETEEARLYERFCKVSHVFFNGMEIIEVVTIGDLHIRADGGGYKRVNCGNAWALDKNGRRHVGEEKWFETTARLILEDDFIDIQDFMVTSEIDWDNWDSAREKAAEMHFQAVYKLYAEHRNEYLYATNIMEVSA